LVAKHRRDHPEVVVKTLIGVSHRELEEKSRWAGTKEHCEAV
jgi:hypothetical protein